MRQKKERATIVGSLPIAAGYVTIQKFQEITGMKQTTIRTKIKEGELLTKKGDGRSSLVLINMYDFCLKAAEQSNLVNDWENESITQ